MKTIITTIIAALLLAGSAPTEAEAQGTGRLVAGLGLAALGAYTLSYDPPDVTATVRGAGRYSHIHEDFVCVDGPRQSAGATAVRVNDNCRNSIRNGFIDYIVGGPVIIVAPVRGEHPRPDMVRKVENNTVYAGTVRTETEHTTAVNRSMPQIVGGAGLIAAGALLAFWPDAPVRVEATRHRVKVGRSFGW